jgi:hypothetical protein
VLADVLTALAYAPHLGPAHGPALLGTSVHRRHVFADRAWALGEELVRPGTAWHVQGSLLGLDHALARLSLRRLDGEMPGRAPGLDPRTALGFARAVALRNAFDLDDAAAGAVAEAIARGRARAARADDLRHAGIFAREAGLDPWRAEGLRHVMKADPQAAARYFTLDELLRLGGPEPLTGEAWGAPDLAGGGALRLRPPPTLGPAAFLGQRPEERLAEAVPDAVWRVALELHARALPARLLPGVLGFFTQDLVQEAAPDSPDDALAVARLARDWPAERFDDYVSALTGDGPLVAAPDPAEPRAR